MIARTVDSGSAHRLSADQGITTIMRAILTIKTDAGYAGLMSINPRQTEADGAIRCWSKRNCHQAQAALHYVFCTAVLV